VELRMNNNLHSLITARPFGAGPGIRVSLHRMFLDAERPVIEALASFIHKPTPEARRAIRDFINNHREPITASRSVTAPRRAVVGSPRGRVHNLRERADAINATYFANRLTFNIIWGKPVRGGKSQRHV